ncbi:MAG: hypothetical protein J7513_12290, partial [Solirubrobacteraceae bacterium]|nr:hypothetical protein [Solirubrobacteraceae bacterium]
MSHPSQRGSSRKDAATRRPLHRLSVLVTSLLLVLGFSPALSQAATANVTQSDLCNAWNANPTSPEVTLASGYKITGSKLVRAGASCAADDAAVSISNSAIAEVSTTSGGSAASRMLAAAVQTAVSESDIKVGDEVFKGASITSLTAVLQNGFIGIKGGIELKWSSGTATKLNFEGRFYALDRFSLVLRSPAEGSVLPSVGGQPINFAGDLVKDSAGYHMNVNGTAPLVTVGEGDKQISVSNATLKMTLANVLTGDGLTVTVTGDGGLGTAVKLTGAKLTAEFDSTGLLKATGNGTVNATIPANGQLPEGKATGTADFTYIRDGKQQADFAGDVKFADAFVANAKGTLDAQTLTFTGDATLTSNDLLVKGAIDGIAYWGDNLAGRTVENRAGAQVQAKKGDVLVKTATASVTAKGVDIKGSARIGDVDGEQWAKGTGTLDLTVSVAGLPDTAIKGTADFGWVKGGNPTVDFKGTVGSGSTAIASATGTVDGNKIDLTGSGSLVNPDLSIKGTVDGVVYYGDKSGDQVAGKDGTKVAAKKGDFILRSATAKVAAKGFDLTGAASMARVGGDLWASGGGTVDLTLGETSLKGSADMTWVSGQLPSVAFKGSLKQGTTAVGNVSGTVDGNKLSLKGDGSFAQNGLAVKGSVEGVVYYGADLSGLTIIDGSGKETAAKKGDWIVKSATADATYQTLKLGATASFGSVAGKEWANASGALSGTYGDTELSGSANVTWVEGASPAATYEGTVKAFGTTLKANGTIDANKITTKGNLSFATAQIAAQGQFEGVLYYGDTTGVTLPNAAGKQVAAKPGDFVVKAAGTGQAMVWNTLVSGDVSLVKAGGDMYATGGGTVSVSGGGVKITGTGSFTWQEEQYPVLAFAGSVTNGTTAVANVTGTLDGRKITLKGDAKITEPNYTFSGAAEGYMYYGTPGARKVENKDGQLVTAAKGDFFLKTTQGKLETKGTTLTGAMSAGKASGVTWVNAGGTIDTTFGNPAVTIKGSANVDWDSATNAITFQGTITTGTTVLTGKGVMDGKKIAFTGDAVSTSPAFSLKGAVEGVVYYADPAGATIADASGKQVAAQKGDFVVTSATGTVTAQNLTLTGKATLGKVGSQVYASGGGTVDATYNGATLKGSATASWILGQAPAVNFEGTVTYGNIVVTGTGTVDGKKVTIKGTAKATDPNYTISGAAEAVYYYADPAGETISDASGKQVAAAKGDAAITSGTATITAKGVTVTGKATAGKNGDKLWVKGDGTVDATYAGVALKGNGTFSWATGTTGVVNFDGTVSAGNTVFSGKGELDGNKISLTATAKATDASFVIDGALSGYVYYGDPAGAKITDGSGKEVAASKGDWSLTSATATLTTKGTTVTGKVTAGKVGSEIWVNAGGTLDVTFGNPAVTIKGSAGVTYSSSANNGAIGFEGTVTTGTTVLTGKGTMDGKKIAFSGTAASTVSGFSLKGAVEGVVYYADPAGDTIADASGKKVAAQKGDFVVTSASGSVNAQNLALTGKATLGKVGSQLYANGTGNVDATYNGATLKGSATASWILGSDPAVTFEGTVSYGNFVVTGNGTVDGKKVTIKGTAKGTESGFAITGAAEGVYYYGDPAGDKILDASGAKVPAAKGDAAITSATATITAKGVTVTGNATAGKNGDSYWVNGNGTLDATFGGVALKGNATATWATGKTAVVNFDGNVSAGNTVFSGKGELDGNKIALTATAKATDSSFTLDGSLSGYVYYGDPAGAKITDASGNQVAASKGDWSLTSATATLTTKGTTVTGNIAAGKVGSDIWIKAGGAIDLTIDGNPAVNIKG